MSAIRITRALSRSLAELSFDEPVTHVYDPMVYARRTAEAYLDRYARPGVPTLLVGMNPGPWGMAQTGVPFGEVALVREWLGIEGPVGKPDPEHAKRPVEGFDCTRSEVSGRRMWGWARERFGDADAFFDAFFVWNYCPLAFLEESGRNRTPDKLPAAEREPLFERCDDAFRKLVRWLAPERVVGIGKFAEDRARTALAAGRGLSELPVGTVLHPSPASPIANRGWAPQAEKRFRELGIELPA